MKILERGGYGRNLHVLSPFIATAYHDDKYPKGNEKLGPSEGNTGKWDMYHGFDVPGFIAHPHRGFETITAVELGVVDHSDGLGNSGRYCNGDVQWMTAGKGLQHCEMFPLLNTKSDNPLILFQIWLNLESKNKLVSPEYKMLWFEDIPVIKLENSIGKITTVKLIAGTEGNIKALEPTSHSYAKDPENHVGIKFVSMEPESEYSLKKISKSLNRAIYIYEGSKVNISGEEFGKSEYAFLNGNEIINLKNTGKDNIKFLLLEGEPIKEPVAMYGPFVMNNMDEIRQAYIDFGKTGFGGWTFNTDEVVHDKNAVRFSKFSNGITEYPNSI